MLAEFHPHCRYSYYVHDTHHIHKIILLTEQQDETNSSTPVGPNSLKMGRAEWGYKTALECAEEMLAWKFEMGLPEDHRVVKRYRAVISMLRRTMVKAKVPV